MKCYIIKDLLPNYVEKLTSEETNTAIKLHLEECDSCLKLYEEMIKPTETVRINDKEYNQKNISEIKYLKKIKKKNTAKIAIGIVIAIIFCLILFGTINMYVLTQIENNKPDYKIVSYNITDDNAYGPSVYNGEIYFPTSDNDIFPDSSNSAPIGYFGYKGEDKPDMFYRLFIENFVYLNVNDDTNEYVKVRGCDFANLKKASKVEKEMDLSKYINFYIFDEDWLHQTAFSLKGNAGMTEMQLETVQSLEDKFGIVEYNEKDFKKYDAFYTIKGYKSGESEDNGALVFPDTIGCILVSDGNYYYGNKENQITGKLLIQIQKLVNQE